MAIPKGNFVALQPLRPTELKVGDFIEKNIQQLIKDGQAKEAARIKRLQEEGKTLMDINKGIKNDPIHTIAPLQQAGTQITKDAMDAADYAMSIAENYSIPIEERREATRIAKLKSQNLVLMNQYLGSKEFTEGWAKKLATPSTEIWKGDDSLHAMTAFANGTYKVKFDDKTGSLMIAYPNQDQTSNDKVVWKDFSEVATSIATPYEKDLSKNTEDFMKNQASKMYRKDTDGRGGNRVVEQNVFLEKEAGDSFETTFGSFDANSKDPMLKQFAYDVLGGKSIQSQEDYDVVKKAYVERLRDYTPKDYSVIDKKSALDIENDRWSLKNKKKSYYSSGSGENTNSGEMIYSNGTSPIQIRDKGGNVLGVQNWNINSVALGKVKGIPATLNSFALGSFKDSKGRQIDKFLMGSSSSNGEMVYSAIPEKDFNEYVSKAGYNPMIIKANLEKGKRALNPRTGKFIDNSIHSNTQISYKTKEVESDDNSFSSLYQQHLKTEK